MQGQQNNGQYHAGNQASLYCEGLERDPHFEFKELCAGGEGQRCGYVHFGFILDMF